MKKRKIIDIVNRVAVIVFCAAVAAFSRASAEQGHFVLGIIKSSPAEEDDTNTTGSAGSTGEKECSVGQSELKCLCGSNLERAHDKYIEELNQTCSTYNVVRDGSFLSFCEETLLDLGYTVTNITSIADNSSSTANDSSSTVTFLNQSTLAETVRSLEASLGIYKRILDRTLIGVYIETEYHRCACLDNYKKWLCATRLKFYMTNSSSPLVRVKPCISLCYQVLQTCPYYLPSQFQYNGSTDNELIYGGYPAFDCPRENKSSAYEFERGEFCIGRNGSFNIGSSGFCLMLAAAFLFTALFQH